VSILRYIIPVITFYLYIPDRLPLKKGGVIQDIFPFKISEDKRSNLFVRCLCSAFYVFQLFPDNLQTGF
jgi:hypothetical protein